MRLTITVALLLSACASQAPRKPASAVFNDPMVFTCGDYVFDEPNSALSYQGRTYENLGVHPETHNFEDRIYFDFESNRPASRGDKFVIGTLTKEYGDYDGMKIKSASFTENHQVKSIPCTYK